MLRALAVIQESTYPFPLTLKHVQFYYSLYQRNWTLILKLSTHFSDLLGWALFNPLCQFCPLFRPWLTLFKVGLVILVKLLDYRFRGCFFQKVQVPTTHAFRTYWDAHFKAYVTVNIWMLLQQTFLSSICYYNCVLHIQNQYLGNI